MTASDPSCPHRHWITVNEPATRKGDVRPLRQWPICLDCATLFPVNCLPMPWWTR